MSRNSEPRIAPTSMDFIGADDSKLSVSDKYNVAEFATNEKQSEEKKGEKKGEKKEVKFNIPFRKQEKIGSMTKVKSIVNKNKEEFNENESFESDGTILDVFELRDGN